MPTDTARRGDARLAGFALFNLGFRPFFLAAGAAAIVLMAVFLSTLQSQARHHEYFGLLVWHGHEMLFGYAGAVIAGFLLTAVRNWTGMETASGSRLMLMFLLWLFGRLAPVIPGLPPAWIAFIDLSFLPVLVAVLARPILKSGQRHNLIVLLILFGMIFSNGLVHAQFVGLTQNTAMQGLQMMADFVMLLITLIAGRVIPFFTEQALGVTLWRSFRLDRLCVLSVFAFTVIQAGGASAAPAIAIAAAVAALLNGLRFYRWHHAGVWQQPMLWVLYLGYGWMVLALVLWSLAAMGIVQPLLAMHALTAGAIGTFTLGMMSRVALGHTGRPIRAFKSMRGAFVLITIGAAIRVLLPMFYPGWIHAIVNISGALWIAAFIIFVAVYAPILIRPRADGRPG